jgi:predicted phosphodiesterase
MRIAILSDIHGNLVALEAVLADLAKAAPDVTICLGDVAVTGPQPRQVIARLHQLSWPIVMGNTDAWLLDPQSWNSSDEETRRLLALEQWSASMMEPEDLQVEFRSVPVDFAALSTAVQAAGMPYADWWLKYWR